MMDGNAPSLKQIVLAVSECIGSFQDGFTTEALLDSFNEGVSFLAISETEPRQPGSRRSAAPMQEASCFGREWIHGLAH